MSVTPTVDKVVKARERINNLLKQSSPKIMEVASVVGFLIDLCKATEYGMLYTKNLERENICALHVSLRCMGRVAPAHCGLIRLGPAGLHLLSKLLA